MERQLRYLLSLSGKSVPIGGSTPLQLTPMLLFKISQHHLGGGERSVSVCFYFFAQSVTFPMAQKPCTRRQIWSTQSNTALLAPVEGRRRRPSSLSPIFSSASDTAIQCPHVDADDSSVAASHLLGQGNSASCSSFQVRSTALAMPTRFSHVLRRPHDSVPFHERVCESGDGCRPHHLCFYRADKGEVRPRHYRRSTETTPSV